ncbi:MAG: YidC/Oxa1 family membrane protein insertase, partial [Actinobacteria bacterium]|nr:YidC/Oxa1 family membrane protein insertase [Actinomycetota bacterium]
WILIVAMAASMFVTQWQMQGRTQGDTATQQKVLMYAMPVFLGFVAQSLPIGVLLYWVTTNVWQLGQQQIIFYEVSHEDGDPGSNGKASGSSDPKGSGGSKGGSKSKPKGSKGSGNGQKKSTRSERSGSGGGPSDHLPRRRRS